jgi:hypothetical protein
MVDWFNINHLLKWGRKVEWFNINHLLKWGRKVEWFNINHLYITIKMGS